VVSGIVEQPITVDTDSSAYWTVCERVLGQVQQFGPLDDMVLGVSGKDLNLTYQRYARLPLNTLRKMVRFEMEGMEGGDDILAGAAVYSAGFEYTLAIGKVRKHQVDDRLKLIDKVGGKLNEISPSCLALFNAYLASAPETPESVLLIDIGRSNTEVVMVDEGYLVFARSIATGGDVFAQAVGNTRDCTPEEAEQIKRDYATLKGADDHPVSGEIYPAIRGAAGQVVKQVQSALSFAKLQLKVNPKFDRVLLSGSGSAIDGLPDYFGGAFCRGAYLEPFTNADMSQLVPEARDACEQLPCRFAVGFGLALAAAQPSQAIALSLVPESARKTSVFSGRLIATVAAGVFLTLGVLLSWVAGAQAQSGAEETLADLTTVHDDLSGKIDDFAGYKETQTMMDSRLVQLRERVESGGSILETLDRLRSVLPDGMWVTGVEFGRRKAERNDRSTQPRELVVSGEANSASIDDPGAVLRKLASEIKDPIRNIASRVQILDSDTAGLVRFELILTYLK
jgi:hypothetical protein